MKIVVWIILFFSLFSSDIFAQISPRAIVKINPLNPLLGRYTLGAEVALDNHSSASLFLNRLNIGYDDFKYTTPNGSEVGGTARLSNWAFMAEYRYYFGKQILKGFYLGGFANYARMDLDISVNGGMTETRGSANAKFNNYGLGGMLGYNFLIKDRFSIDIFGGLGGFWYSLRKINVVYQNDETVEEKIPIPIAGPYPRLGINLGFAF